MKKIESSSSNRRLPSWTLPAGISLFLLFFGGTGFWMAVGLFRSGDWLNGLISTALALVLFISTGVVFAWFTKQRRMILAPDPWLARPDWAKGEIPSSQSATNPVALAILGTVFLLTAGCLAWFGVSHPGVVTFAVLGLGFLMGAASLRRFRTKFGSPSFKMDSVPGVIGETLSGNIIFNMQFDSPPLFTVRLTCLKVMKNHDRSDRTPRAQVLWKRVEIPAVPKPESSGLSLLPIEISIPENSPETDFETVPERIFWQLEAHPPKTGGAILFEVPVFKVHARNFGWQL